MSDIVGTVIDGIAASETVDSSGEILVVEGCDISDLTSGVGVLNWEHRNEKDPEHTALDIVGKIIYAKKIYKREDCENDRQRMYWDKVNVPYIYMRARLYDAAGHAAAQAIAAMFRDHEANNEPVLVRYSIEGATLKKEGNKLVRTIARRVAATIKPANRSCVSGIVSDAGPTEVSKDTLDSLSDKTKKSERMHPEEQILGVSPEFAYEFEPIAKALDQSQRLLIDSVASGYTSSSNSDYQAIPFEDLKNYVVGTDLTGGGRLGRLFASRNLSLDETKQLARAVVSSTATQTSGPGLAGLAKVVPNTQDEAAIQRVLALWDGIKDAGAITKDRYNEIDSFIEVSQRLFAFAKNADVAFGELNSYFLNDLPEDYWKNHSRRVRILSMGNPNAFNYFGPKYIDETLYHINSGKQTQQEAADTFENIIAAWRAKPLVFAGREAVVISFYKTHKHEFLDNGIKFPLDVFDVNYNVHALRQPDTIAFLADVNGHAATADYFMDVAQKTPLEHALNRSALLGAAIETCKDNAALFEQNIVPKVPKLFEGADKQQAQSIAANLYASHSQKLLRSTGLSPELRVKFIQYGNHLVPLELVPHVLKAAENDPDERSRLASSVVAIALDPNIEAGPALLQQLEKIPDTIPQLSAYRKFYDRFGQGAYDAIARSNVPYAVSEACAFDSNRVYDTLRSVDPEKKSRAWLGLLKSGTVGRPLSHDKVVDFLSTFNPTELGNLDPDDFTLGQIFSPTHQDATEEREHKRDLADALYRSTSDFVAALAFGGSYAQVLSRGDLDDNNSPFAKLKTKWLNHGSLDLVQRLMADSDISEQDWNVVFSRFRPSDFLNSPKNFYTYSGIGTLKALANSKWTGEEVSEFMRRVVDDWSYDTLHNIDSEVIYNIAKKADIDQMGDDAELFARVAQNMRRGEGGALLGRLMLEHPRFVGVLENYIYNTDTSLVSYLQMPSDMADKVMAKYPNLSDKMREGLTASLPPTHPLKLPDGRFNQKTTAKFDSSRLRILRDSIIEKGGAGKGISPKQLPPGDWKKFALPNGNISAEKIQQHIDTMPGVEYNVSHSIWDKGGAGIQTHSRIQPNRVLQLNITNSHLQQMDSAGVLDTFKKLSDASHYSSHPVLKGLTVGWVRYSGPDLNTRWIPGKGKQFFVDEVQTDFGQRLGRIVRQQAEEAGRDPDEAESEVNAKFPPAHLDTIKKILFGNKGVNEVLYEGFLQHARNMGYTGAKVAIHDVTSKAKVTGWEKDGGNQSMYRDYPVRAGMKPGKYGQLEEIEDGRDTMGNSTWQGDLLKALEAGSYNVAPGALTGGSALQVEDRKLRRIKDRIVKAIGAWDKKSDLKTHLKNELPDVDPDFVERFADLADDLTVKLKKAEGTDKRKITVVAPHHKEQYQQVRGSRPIPKSPSDSYFDEGTGTLHTDLGSFRMNIPSDKKYVSILNGPDVQPHHDAAMKNWLVVNKLLHEGKLPKEVAMHAAIFSGMSPSAAVPMQELAFSHFQDMYNRGMDPRDPSKVTPKDEKEFYARVGTGGKLPKYHNEYWKGPGGDATRTNAWKDSQRQPDMFGGPPNLGNGQKGLLYPKQKWNSIQQYHKLHPVLTGLIEKYGTDIRSISRELMNSKYLASLTGGSEREGYLSDVEGFAPKTTRYLLAMLGGGNVTVPDTHFIRHTFGLPQDKVIRQDAENFLGRPLRETDKTIEEPFSPNEHLKNVLWDEKNTDTLEALDRYYYQNHPAVKYTVDRFFGGKPTEQALFPAFWAHWLSVAPHERALGMPNSNQNDGTDHGVYWHKIDEILRKHGLDGLYKAEEDEYDLPYRTALAHKEIEDMFGPAPAAIAYYSHILPHLLEAHERRTDPMAGSIVKMESLLIDLRKAAEELGLPKDEPASPNEGREYPSVVFKDSYIKPGKMTVNAYPPTQLLIVGRGDLKEDGHDDYLVTAPRILEHKKLAGHDYVPFRDIGTTRRIPQSYIDNGLAAIDSPHMVERSNSIVNAPEHVMNEFVTSPEQHRLVHGFDVNSKPIEIGESVKRGVFADKGLAGWHRMPNGAMAYVKTNESDTHSLEYEAVTKEGLFDFAARSFFGMGKYLAPNVTVFKNPYKHKENVFAAIQAIPGAKESKIVANPRTRKVAHSGPQQLVLNNLGDSGELDKLMMMDYVLGNSDRHSGNYMFVRGDDGLRLIDHGYSFGEGSGDVPDYWTHWNNNRKFTGYQNAGNARFHPIARQWFSSLDKDKLISMVTPHISQGELYGLNRRWDTIHKAVNTDALVSRLDEMYAYMRKNEDELNKSEAGDKSAAQTLLDSKVHGMPNNSSHPDQMALIDGFNVDSLEKGQRGYGGIHSNHSFWHTMPNGKSAYIKKLSDSSFVPQNATDLSFFSPEVSYWRAAREVFGMGHYVSPATVLFQHPKTNDWHVATQAFPNAREVRPYDRTVLERPIDAHKIATMDFVCGMIDRHSGNAVHYRDGEKHGVGLIDHELTFGDLGPNPIVSAMDNAIADWRKPLSSNEQSEYDKWIAGLDVDKFESILREGHQPEKVVSLYGNGMRRLQKQIASGKTLDQVDLDKE